MKGITRKKSSAKNYLQYTCVYIYYFVFNLKKNKFKVAKFQGN